ncbi:Aste57867_12707 [Aphanomyces stellatus]|uniref:Aste57867_12707 protein n=1 Tax=Aphanomyces stellatus TaxID=120398 RepID=A0A485KWM8_9STRA|nr:hypothetical protein As57867_012659 [Aphanomyces stellatus]VFT89557.1 Aste57867_12707 [Aphanomyces stellatus]
MIRREEEGNETEALLRAKILLHELKRAVAIESTQQGTSNFKAMARTLLSVIQVQHSVTTTSPSMVPFGLTPENVRDTWGLNDMEKLSMMKEAMRVLLPPEIEARLQTHCCLLCDVFYPTACDDTPLSFSHIHRLPHELAATDTNVRVMEGEKATLEAACEQALVEHIKVLTETTKHLVAVIKCYKLDVHTSYYTPKVEFLQACLSAMQQKIELMTKQLLVETYTDKTLDALADIRRRLEHRHQQATAKRFELEAAVHAANEDPEWKEIRERYAHVQRQIHAKRRVEQSTQGSRSSPPRS